MSLCSCADRGTDLHLHYRKQLLSDRLLIAIAISNYRKPETGNRKPNRVKQSSFHIISYGETIRNSSNFLSPVSYIAYTCVRSARGYAKSVTGDKSYIYYTEPLLYTLTVHYEQDLHACARKLECAAITALPSDELYRGTGEVRVRQPQMQSELHRACALRLGDTHVR